MRLETLCASLPVAAKVTLTLTLTPTLSLTLTLTLTLKDKPSPIDRSYFHDTEVRK